MRILVTRPKGKERSLVAALAQAGHQVHYQPIVQMCPGPDLALPVAALKAAEVDLLIFVSTFAVDYFIQALGEPQLLQQADIALFAVGKATAKRLEQWAAMPVLSPTLETSEGLLALPKLSPSAVAGKKIAIARGVDGRELLFEQLKSRQAEVTYWQLYQRLVVAGQDENWYDLWKGKQIECIIVTSVAILAAIFAQLPAQAKPWLISRRYVVASARIADSAQHLGIPLANITDAQGATDEAIIAAVQRIIEA